MHTRIFVCIEAVRNSYDLLHRFLRQFVQGYLESADDDRDSQSVYEFWVALGVVPDLVDELVDLGLRWVGGKLRGYAARV